MEKIINNIDFKSPLHLSQIFYAGVEVGKKWSNLIAAEQAFINSLPSNNLYDIFEAYATGQSSANSQAPIINPEFIYKMIGECIFEPHGKVNNLKVNIDTKSLFLNNKKEYIIKPEKKFTINANVQMQSLAREVVKRPIEKYIHYTDNSQLIAKNYAKIYLMFPYLFQNN